MIATQHAQPRTDSAAPDNDVVCPLCGSPSRTNFEKRGHAVRTCEDCNHRFAVIEMANEDPGKHVSDVYGDEYFSGGGAGYADYLAEARLLTEHGRRYAKLLSQYTTPGRVLDVGSAAGFVLEGFVDNGWEGVGVEPNDSVAATGRARGLDLRTGMFEEFEDAQPFDLVSLVQVIAHFVDPRGVCERVASLTRPGGYCLVETWNVASWSARLFGRAWHEYSPPSVLHWFRPSILASLFGDHGFEQVATGRPAKWLDGAHAKSLLAHAVGEGLIGRLTRPALALVPDRMRIPYPAEDLFWALFRRV